MGITSPGWLPTDKSLHSANQVLGSLLSIPEGLRVFPLQAFKLGIPGEVLWGMCAPPQAQSTTVGVGAVFLFLPSASLFATLRSFGKWPL